MVSELRKQLYMPVSRSEEGSQGRSELFCVRGVHRSAAKTLDGLRSEGYLQGEPSIEISWEGYSCVRRLYLFPVAQEVMIMSSLRSERARQPPAGAFASEHCELCERASEARRKGENL